jgi:hypothetical protein
MLPSAVALAPALLRGALKVKVLVPQSSIPGRGSTRAFGASGCATHTNVFELAPKGPF